MTLVTSLFGLVVHGRQEAPVTRPTLIVSDTRMKFPKEACLDAGSVLQLHNHIGSQRFKV